MSDDRYEAGLGGPYGNDLPRGSRPWRLMAALPWLLGGLIVLGTALAAGLATAYLVASLRQAPLPASLISPTPIVLVTPTPEPSPSPPASPSTAPGPSPSPSPTQEPAPEATPLVHTVSAGESISLIAVEYDTTVEAIVELNQLENPNRIFPGQQLLIPPPED
ncbi:MAG TPA: LysM domain-containing protein [Candidatus Limnocylindria bacterium]|nr:LysM domain-containing protein [Candidatus Limnocylindria bacterium]